MAAFYIWIHVGVLLWLLYLVTADTDHCPQLRLMQARIYNSKPLQQADTYKAVTIDKRTKEVLILEHEEERLLDSDITAKYDVYKIDGQTDIRRFFIMHAYEDYRTADGWWSKRSLGQLTVAQDGSMIIGTPSLREPLETVTMCDRNVFQIVRTGPTQLYPPGVGFNGYEVRTFVAIKYFENGKQSELCAVQNRHRTIMRLTPPGKCSNAELTCF